MHARPTIDRTASARDRRHGSGTRAAECLIYTGSTEGLCSAYCGPINHCQDYLLAGTPPPQECQSIGKALTNSTPTPGSSTAQCTCNTNGTTISVGGIDCASLADVCEVACICFGGVGQTACGM